MADTNDYITAETLRQLLAQNGMVIDEQGEMHVSSVECSGSITSQGGFFQR